ncbi:MAG: serine protease [bacterium]|nr:serine protease [bacterium]
MEELNKTQIVLLTLFITFVTSVTTGIVTVTLLQQAPQGVTQTINRVVEHTIEKITPVTTRTETRVVGQEDEIIKTASLIKPAIVRITSSVSTAVASTSDEQLAGILVATNLSDNEVGTGFLVSSDGLVATAYSVIPDHNISYGVFVGDKKYQANVIIHNKNEGLAILKIEHDKATKFVAPQFASKPVTLGQTIIVLGRDLDRYTVSVGLVASLKEATLSSLPIFKTTVRSDNTNIGGPLLSSTGQVVGLNLENGNALPIELIKSGMASTTRATN